jgi:hypothetical protein
MATQAEAQYLALRRELLRDNQKTYSFYHDLVHKRLHEPVKAGQDTARIEQIRRENETYNVEYSVLEELGLSYRFPANYEVSVVDGQPALTMEGFGVLHDQFNPDGPRSQHWPEARKGPDSINYRRARQEYTTMRTFEQTRLASAKPGETFIWTSPTVYDIHLLQTDPPLTLDQKQELLKEIGYGFQSYIFTYVVQEDGSLQPRSHSTYFNPTGLKELYKRIYGEQKLAEFPPDEQLDMHLLGRIEDLPCSPDHLQQLIEELRQDPANLFDLPDSIKNSQYHLDAAQQALQRARPLVDYYYYLQRNITEDELYDPDFQYHINNAYRLWRDTAYGLMGDVPCPELELFNGLSQGQLEAFARAHIAELRGIAAQSPASYDLGDRALFMGQDDYIRQAAFAMDQMRAYMPVMEEVATGCGIGAGFSAAGGGSLYEVSSPLEYDPLALTTTYEGMYARSEMTMVNEIAIACPDCRCKCTYKLSEVKAARQLKCKGTKPGGKSCENVAKCWEPFFMKKSSS